VSSCRPRVPAWTKINWVGYREAQQAPHSQKGLVGVGKELVTNTTLTGQLVSLGEPRVLKTLHAKPISPRVESNNESLTHLFVGYPMRSLFGMINGSADFDGLLQSESDSSSPSKSKSSSSSGLNRRTEVKNFAKIAPRLWCALQDDFEAGGVGSRE
jgi:hypothetical protein